MVVQFDLLLRTSPLLFPFGHLPAIAHELLENLPLLFVPRVFVCSLDLRGKPLAFFDESIELGYLFGFRGIRNIVRSGINPRNDVPIGAHSIAGFPAHSCDEPIEQLVPFSLRKVFALSEVIEKPSQGMTEILTVDKYARSRHFQESSVVLYSE